MTFNLDRAQAAIEAVRATVQNRLVIILRPGTGE
jgi:hypothetical protein